MVAMANANSNVVQQSQIVSVTQQTPPPPPPPPISMIPTNQTNPMNKRPNQLIAKAASNTVEAIGALTNYAVSSGASLKQTNQKLTLPSNHEIANNTNNNNIQVDSTPNNNNNSNNNNSSINFNGDRLVMNNTAGSRRPLTGYSSFN